MSISVSMGARLTEFQEAIPLSVLADIVRLEGASYNISYFQIMPRGKLLLGIFPGGPGPWKLCLADSSGYDCITLSDAFSFNSTGCSGAYLVNYDDSNTYIVDEDLSLIGPVDITHPENLIDEAGRTAVCIGSLAIGYQPLLHVSSSGIAVRGGHSYYASASCVDSSCTATIYEDGSSIHSQDYNSTHQSFSQFLLPDKVIYPLDLYVVPDKESIRPINIVETVGSATITVAAPFFGSGGQYATPMLYTVKTPKLTISYTQDPSPQTIIMLNTMPLKTDADIRVYLDEGYLYLFDGTALWKAPIG